MKFYLFLFLFFFCNVCNSFAQKENSLKGLNEDKEAVAEVILQLFNGMRNKDVSQIEPLFSESAGLSTTFVDENGKPRFQQESIEEFLNSIKNLPEDIKADEQVWSFSIEIDGPLATAWTPYSFFVNGNLSHCGSNAFQLHQDSTSAWKIHYITDTRSRQGCMTEAPKPAAELDSLLVGWHRDAAETNLEPYFDLMSDDFYFLGTDPEERWGKAAFFDFCKPYFDNGEAWDFSATQREVYLDGDHQTAWFEETLDTHMGPCRGSGVFRKTAAGWKIDHYVLSLLLPNEDMKQYKSTVLKE